MFWYYMSKKVMLNLYSVTIETDQARIELVVVPDTTDSLRQHTILVMLVYIEVNHDKAEIGGASTAILD